MHIWSRVSGHGVYLRKTANKKPQCCRLTPPASPSSPSLPPPSLVHARQLQSHRRSLGEDFFCLTNPNMVLRESGSLHREPVDTHMTSASMSVPALLRLLKTSGAKVRDTLYRGPRTFPSQRPSPGSRGLELFVVFCLGFPLLPHRDTHWGLVGSVMVLLVQKADTTRFITAPAALPYFFSPWILKISKQGRCLPSSQSLCLTLQAVLAYICPPPPPCNTMHK